MRRWWNGLILLLATAVGGVAFLSPFFGEGDATATAHASDAPFLVLALVGLCLVAVVANLMAGAMHARTVALLGILSAVNAVLRAVPGPAGFSAIFFLLILCGYTYGPTFGFLMGALSLLVSALLGAGVGPWLPFQMFAAGWVGLSSGLLPDLHRHPRWELVLLATWGALWGLAFGAIMNLWFWPYLAGPSTVQDAYWQPGLGLAAALRRYAAFYLVTSLWWDLGRAGGNAVLILLLGRPILRVLRRFRRVLQFTQSGPGPAPAADTRSRQPCAPARAPRPPGVPTSRGQGLPGPGSPG